MQVAYLLRTTPADVDLTLVESRTADGVPTTAVTVSRHADLAEAVARLEGLESGGAQVVLLDDIAVKLPALRRMVREPAAGGE